MRLLEPLAIGPLAVPSRVVFGPHETNLCRGRAISDRHVAYYRRRAEGGVGLIITETASVHPGDWPYERAPLASECGPGWEAVSAACHAEGAFVVASLGHAGGQGSSAYSQAAMWAPSRVPEVNTREVPQQMEVEEIGEVVEGFAASAALAVASGCDGVELDAGPFGLIRQFLSGLTNHRGDTWGEDRARFAREVIAAVRSAVGPDAVVGLRLSADELAPWAGIVPEAGASLAAELAGPEGQPLLHYVTVVRGAIFSAQQARPDAHTPPGFNLDLAGAVRAAVRERHGDDVAVVAQGSIVDVDQADWAVGEGDRVDAVEMTRALLADAELVAKLVSGVRERIRPCLLCNQTCWVRDARNPVVTCVMDPRTGHELDDPDEAAVSNAQREGTAVTVLGAGVAGLEAARVAALRGRRVQVLSAEDAPGGMLRTAARGAGRERLALAVDWLEAECRRLGVEVRTGVTLTAEDVVALDGDVVVATGSTARVPEYKVTKSALVLDAAAFLHSGTVGVDGPVLVWDPVGGPVGVSVAERLAAEGREVHLATGDNIVGNELARSGDLAPANARLQQAGVVLHRRSLLRSVRKSGAVLEHRFSGEQRVVEVVAVVDAGHRLPDPLGSSAGELAVARAGRGLTVRAGDCVAPRTIHEAVLEGRRAALALDGIGTTSDGVPMGTAAH